MPGGVFQAQGDGPGALAAFREALGIGKRLVAQDPANAGWQRDLAVSSCKLAQIYHEQGKGTELISLQAVNLQP